MVDISPINMNKPSKWLINMNKTNKMVNISPINMNKTIKMVDQHE